MKRREGLILWVLALVCVPLLVLSIMVAAAPHTSDFGCFWTSGQTLLEGADPYDTRGWGLRNAGTYPDAFGVERAPFCGPRWPYPLWTALFFTPWALLPLGVAAWAWQLLLLAGVTGGIALVLRVR